VSHGLDVVAVGVEDEGPLGASEEIPHRVCRQGPLDKELAGGGSARYMMFEGDPMCTKRESESIGQVASRAILTLFIAVGSVVAARAVEIVSGPTLTMDPNGMTPLAGVVELETDTPVQAELTITDGIEQRTVTFPDAL